MLDVPWYAAPCGRTERKPPAPSVCVTVSVIVTAVAPTGTTEGPKIDVVTDTARSSPAASFVPPLRVSWTRAGLIGVNAPAVVGPAICRQVPGVPAATHNHKPPVSSSYNSPT